MTSFTTHYNNVRRKVFSTHIFYTDYTKCALYVIRFSKQRRIYRVERKNIRFVHEKRCIVTSIYSVFFSEKLSYFIHFSLFFSTHSTRRLYFRLVVYIFYAASKRARRPYTVDNYYSDCNNQGSRLLVLKNYEIYAIVSLKKW